MRRRVFQVLQIKPGEGAVTSLMFLYIFGVLAFYYILKPLRAGLFLKDLDSSQLPYAYFLTAVFAGTLATLVFKLSRPFSAITLLTGTNLAIMASMLSFRWAMGRQISYMPYIFYVYVQIVSVLATAQFWLLAGYIYDSRQAKRIYGLLGAGAIAGSMAGSSFVAFYSKRFSPEFMLLLCFGLCFALIVTSQIAWRLRRAQAEIATASRKRETRSEGFVELTRLAFGSRHLFWMVLLTFLTLIASQISDWQVNDAVQDSLGHLPKQEMQRQIGEFWGKFYLFTNILGLFFQLTLTGFVVRRFGIGAAILFLPMGLFLTSLGVCMSPSLWTTTLALGSNSVFRYSINRAGMELLYMPLSPEVRKKIKLFIDVFVDRLGRAIAGLIILLFTYLGSGLRGTALSILILTGTCLIMSLQLRKTYVDAFRHQLARRDMDLAAVGRYVTDPASVRLLVGALENSQERQILYCLRLLQSVRGGDFARELLPLLDHSSPYVREQALQTLPALAGDYRAAAERLLADKSEGVRLAAVDYLCSYDPAQTEARLEALLKHDDIDIRLAAARWVSEHAGPSFRPSLELVKGFLAIGGANAVRARAAAARLVARLQASESIPILRDLLRDQEPEVAAEAARAAGKAGHLALLHDVLSMLECRDLRGPAREALVMYGPRITGTLGDLLGDPRCALALRCEIPWVLGRIPTQGSADALVDNIGVEEPLLKYRVVKALNRIHELKPELPAPRPAIAERVYAETRAYYEVLALCQSLESQADVNGSKLLTQAVRERLDQNLEIIFRLLGLEHPQKDIYSAYSALKGERTDRRAAAIEYLDNLLQKNLKTVILPLLEESSTERLIDRASHLFGIQARRREEALRIILQQSDPWLKSCALHEVGKRRITGLLDLCRALSGDRDPMVRETAEWALNRFAS